MTNETPRPPKEPGLRDLLFHPVSIIAGTIVFAVIALIGMAVMGWDRGGVLRRLADYNFARGLITYLFGVGTIGVAVALVVGALLGGEEMKERFARAKEVLALLLGIFGTMVGFYYGSELAGRTKESVASTINLADPKLYPGVVTPGASITVASHVEGGSEPLTFAVRLLPELKVVARGQIDPSGMILESFTISAGAPPGLRSATLVVYDALGDSTTRQGSFLVGPSPK